MSEDDTAPTFTTEPLAKRHQRDKFSCGIEPLDRYLKTQTSQDARRGYAASIVAVTDDNTVIAYYTLSSYRIDPRPARRRNPETSQIPGRSGHPAWQAGS